MPWSGAVKPLRNHRSRAAQTSEQHHVRQASPGVHGKGPAECPATATLGDVYFKKIFPLGLDACVEAANLIESGNAPKIPQDDSKATYESWCKKSDARIDWKKPGNEIYNLIRGCNPQPGAWAEFMGDEYTFFDSRFIDEQSAEHFPGQIISINAENVRIAVKGGFIEVSRFKSDQGKLFVKDMNTAVFTEGDLFS